MEMWALRKLREIVDPGHAKPEYARRKGLERKKEILKFISVRPGTTPYSMAKSLYGKPGDPKAAIKGYKALKQQLDQLEKITGLFDIKKVNGARHFSLTEEGKKACENFGVLLPSNHAGVITSALNGFKKEPLTTEETWQLEKLLTDHVIDAMEEITKNFVWNKSSDFLPKTSELSPKGPNERLDIALELKMEVKKLEEEMREEGKSKSIQMPELPRAFVISTTVLRWEVKFKKELLKSLGLFQKLREFLIAEQVRKGKGTRKAAEEIITRVYLERISHSSSPYMSIRVKKDFDKISCGYYLFKRDPRLGEKFREIGKWIGNSFLKDCDPLVSDYMIMIGYEMDRRMEKYARVWADRELDIMKEKASPLL